MNCSVLELHRKALYVWVMELVGGESEDKKILILLGRNKTAQREEEMRGG